MSPLYSPRRNVSFKSNIYVWHVIVTKIRMACNSHKNARKLYFSSGIGNSSLHLKSICNWKLIFSRSAQNTFSYKSKTKITFSANISQSDTRKAIPKLKCKRWLRTSNQKPSKNEIKNMSYIRIYLLQFYKIYIFFKE